MINERRENPLAARMLIYSARKSVPVVGRLLQIILGSDFGFQKCGEGLFMPHPYGIIVHSAVQIGKHCDIFQGVTIGGSRVGSGVPTIGDFVSIGAGAKILGGINIGDHVKVGANAVVTKSVPPGVTVVGFNQWKHIPQGDRFSE